ncbi:FliH/SctL family protein, partial [Cellulomonas endophytica]|uniref:FliH/SctL family protein n=1 Tax=Cellulomonas endophytica TaxID=2494735 RepID=UPI001011BD84
REAARDAQLAAALATLARAARAAQGAAVPVLDEVEDALLGGAVELARAVLGRELQDAEHSARAALARVLEHPRRPRALTVRLHPRDLAALAAAGGVPADGDVVLVADPRLAPGDAVGEHPDGLLDACLAGTLARAAEALRDGTAR